MLNFPNWTPDTELLGCPVAVLTLIPENDEVGNNLSCWGIPEHIELNPFNSIATTVSVSDLSCLAEWMNHTMQWIISSQTIYA